jgi:UDP-2,3-diacylglucosamine pyrophosphatase LpxH
MGENRAKLRLVVSDFHLGKGRYFSDGTQNILEDFIYDREFAEFLDYHCRGDYAEAEVELILNGDILNLLQIDTYGVHTHLITERSVVRGLHKIIEGHREFFDALKRWSLTPGHTISYVIGNHDVGMIFLGAQGVFSKACGGDVKFFTTHYELDGVYIEHGQQYERFAKTDLERPLITRGLPEPVLNLPWGSLFVAVLLPKIKQVRPHVDKVRPFGQFLSWTLIYDFWWSILTGLRIGIFIWNTLLLRSRYQLTKGSRRPWELLREISIYPSYDKIAFRILDEREDVHCVIFGHTHVLRYRQWREGKEYFNEGTWNEVTNLDLGEYGTRTRLTYAFIEYREGKPHVRLKEWRGVWRPEVEIQV